MDNKKRNIVITLIALLAIGFASVSSVLVINGLLAIGENSDDFKIIFTSASIDGAERNDVISESKTEISYETKVLSLIDEESTLEYEATNTSRNYDADVQIVCNIVDESENIIEGENEYVDMTYTPKSMELLAGETKQGSITAKLKKAVTEAMDINIKCTLNATAKERDKLPEEEKVCTFNNPTIKMLNDWEWKDNDCSKDITIGDELTIGSESFYVYNTDTDQYKLLAKYNLEVGNAINSSYPADKETYLQSPRALGYKSGVSKYATVIFSTDEVKGSYYSTYTGSVVEGYVKEYKKKLVSMGLTEESVVTLITATELDELGCERVGSSGTCKSAPEFVYNTSYWTRTSVGIGEVQRVLSSGSCGPSLFDIDSNFGVRPVIKVIKSEFDDKTSEIEDIWTFSADNDNNGVISIGDELTIGSESFYVYNTANNRYKLLAKYNLEVGNETNSSYPADEETYLQSPRALGYKKNVDKYATVAFSSSSVKGRNYNSYIGSIVEGYVKEYKKKLVMMGLPEITEVTLISKEELVTLGCKSSNSEYTCELAPEWVYGTSYWTRSPNVSNNVEGAWYVSTNKSNFHADYNYDSYYGVRPVLFIPASSV